MLLLLLLRLLLLLLLLQRSLQRLLLQRCLLQRLLLKHPLLLLLLLKRPAGAAMSLLVSLAEVLPRPSSRIRSMPSVLASSCEITLTGALLLILCCSHRGLTLRC